MTEIPTFDVDGKEISYKTALQSIEAAIEKFQDFDTKRLQANLDRLKTVRMELPELGSTAKKVTS